MTNTPFRSIGQEGRQTFDNYDVLQAQDHAKNLGIYAQQQQQKLESYQRGLQRANEFEARNAQRNEQVEINQTRLKQSNEITNLQIAAKNQEIVDRQALDNQRLAIQYDRQIRDMQNAQEIVRNQLSLQFMSQERKALSNFGESFLKLSSTLAEKEIERINQENQRAREEARMKELLELDGTGALEKINQLQRFNAGADLDSQANALENEGNRRDSTNLRSHNGWALYGAMEGKAIKSGLSLERRLGEVVQLALQDGTLAYGNPNFERDVHVLLNKKLRSILSEDDLLNVPNAVIADYFQPAMLKAMASLTEKHFADNAKLTKESGTNRALSEFQVGAASERFVEDLPLLASGILMKDPLNASKNLKKAATLIGETATSLGPLEAYRDFLLTSDLGKNFGIEALIEVEQQIDGFRDVTLKANLAEAKKEAKLIKFRFQKEARTLRDLDRLPQLRDEALEALSRLPEEAQSDHWLDILSEDMADNIVIKQRNDEQLQGVSPYQMSATIDRLLDEYQPPEEYKRLSDLRNKFEGIVEQEEDIQRAVSQLENEIDNLIPFQAKATDNLTKLITGFDSNNAYLRAAELRKEEIQEFVKDYYATEQNPTANGLRDTIRKVRPDLFKEIDPREFTFLNDQRLKNEITYGSYKRSRQAVFSMETSLTQIPGGKKAGVSYLNPETNAYAVRGLLGELDGNTGIFLTPTELESMSANWELGIIDEKLDSLSDLADMSPRQFLAAQMKFYPGTGTLQRREYPAPQNTGSSGDATQVTYKYAYDFARDFGLSAKGATVIANAMMEESTGITTREHDKENGSYTGYGLFGHRLSRRDALFEYAERMGRKPEDPIAQLTFALNEIKNEYPSLFAILQSPNAKKEHYFHAMERWLRFHHSLHGKRRSSLYRDLEALN